MTYRVRETFWKHEKLQSNTLLPTVIETWSDAVAYIQGRQRAYANKGHDEKQDEWWARWFRDAGVAPDAHRPRGGIRLDSQANEGHAAMAGQGFALLTPLLWRGDVAGGRLVQPFELTSTAGYAYWLAYPPERRMVPKVKRFREWLLDSFRGEVGERIEAYA